MVESLCGVAIAKHEFRKDLASHVRLSYYPTYSYVPDPQPRAVSRGGLGFGFSPLPLHHFTSNDPTITSCRMNCACVACFALRCEWEKKKVSVSDRTSE